MKIHQVKSSAISAIGYNRKNRELAVKFNSGHTYMYANVPKGIFTKMRKAESVGKFFHEHVFGRFDALKAE